MTACVCVKEGGGGGGEEGGGGARVCLKHYKIWILFGLPETRLRMTYHVFTLFLNGSNMACIEQQNAECPLSETAASKYHRKPLVQSVCLSVCLRMRETLSMYDNCLFRPDQSTWFIKKEATKRRIQNSCS